MRKLFGKIHLWLSIPVGIILSIICFSGVALVFEKEITQACKPHLYKVSVPEGNAAVLPPSQLIARIKEQTADSLKLTSLQYSGKADETATVTFKNAGRKSLSVHGRSERMDRRKHFFSNHAETASLAAEPSTAERSFLCRENDSRHLHPADGRNSCQWSCYLVASHP